MKVNLGIVGDEDDLDQLAKLGERSGLLRAGIHAVENDPALIPKTIEHMLAHPKDGPGPGSKARFIKEKRSGMSVEVKDLDILDRIARSLIATRNYAAQIIIKGILAGIISIK